ncbi:MAG TPA: Imm44 family immunity protein [Gemmatimonadaceae bacterium]
MKLWMSGEIDSDVADAYRLVRIPLEKQVNELLSRGNYGGNIDEWAVIPMITRITNPDYKEIARLSKDRRTAEFRLRIPHDAFLAASPAEQRRLVVEMLVACVIRMPSLRITDLDGRRLMRDLQDL